jgi:hypothetical protein
MLSSSDEETRIDMIRNTIHRLFLGYNIDSILNEEGVLIEEKEGLSVVFVITLRDFMSDGPNTKVALNSSAIIKTLKHYFDDITPQPIPFTEDHMVAINAFMNNKNISMTYPGVRAAKIEELSNNRGAQIVKTGIAKVLHKYYRLTPNIEKAVFEWIKEGDHTQCVIDTDSLRLKLTLLPTMADTNIPSDKCVAIRRFSKIYTSIIQLTRYEPVYTVKVSHNSKSLTDLDMNRVYLIFNMLDDDEDQQQQDNKARLNWLIQGLIDSDVLTTVTTLTEDEKKFIIKELEIKEAPKKEVKEVAEKTAEEAAKDEAEKKKKEEERKMMIKKLEEKYLDRLVKLSLIRAFQKRLTEYFKYIKDGDYIQSNLLHRSWTMDHIESRVTINANNGSLVIIQGVTRYPVGGYMKEIVHDIDKIHLRGLINK